VTYVDHQTTAPVAPRHSFAHTEHDVSRVDDYAWLRDKHGDESVAYLRAERAYYDAAVAPLADLTAELRAEMVARIPQSSESVHWRAGGREYFTRDVPGQEYEQFCRVGLDGSGTVEVLLDANELLGDGDFIELGVREVSPDGNWLAYSCDTDGDEVYELRFRDLRTGIDLPRTVAHTYYTGAWSADSTTFFYTVNDELYRPYQVWRHRIDDPDAPEALVFEDLDGKYDVEVHATRSGELIVIHTANRNTSEVWLVPADRPDQPAQVVEPRRTGVEYGVSHLPGVGGGHLLITTNDAAQEFRVMRAPLATPGRAHWVEVISERPDERIHGVHAFADHVVVDLVRDARQVLRILPVAAVAEGVVADGVDLVPDFPGGLLWMGPNEEFDVREIITRADGALQPNTWYAVDLDTGERRVLKQIDAPGFDAGHYVAEQHSVPARDGVEIPVTIVRRSDVALNGSAPLLLYGYGAYESAWWPGFEPSLPSALDRGVVFAHAHIRGGGEGGRRWWLQGSMAHKITTFTDFIDVADGLAQRGWIDGSRIVSRGLSAGGLLQGAVYSMRPDRWAGVVAEVPFVDVVTTMFDASIPLTINEWDEWGDPRIREQFDWLLEYSPYDNVPGVEQPDAPPRPRLLVTGALNDPRVSVHEPAKWVAKLRASQRPDDAPVLFRVEIGDGGHTGPQGRFAAMGYEAEVYAWILDVMGMS
jgi:oligopeptidase B